MVLNTVVQHPDITFIFVFPVCIFKPLTSIPAFHVRSFSHSSTPPWAIRLKWSAYNQTSNKYLCIKLQ